MTDDPRVEVRLPVSPAAAALLNLTGLAIGYGYLRRWRRAAIHLAGTVVLVVAAFATDAANVPWVWRAVAACWLGWMAFDALRLARAAAGAGGYDRRPVPLVTAVVAVIAIVAGFLVYGAAGRGTYAEALAAQGRADCAAAITRFDAVTGPFELTLSRDVPAAATNRDQCVAFAAAERAERDNLFSDAVTRYLNHRRTYPSSTLAPFVHQYLKRTYSTWAGMLRRAGEHTKGIEVYRALLTETGVEPDAERVREDLAQTHLELAAEARDQLPTAEPEARVTRARTAVDALLVVRRELGDTTAAQTVPQAVVDTYTAANSLFTEQRFCDALPVLDYFVTVPDADTAGVVGAANADRAVAMLECGLAAYRGGDFRTAIDRLTAMATAYPEHPGTAQARSAVIAANVALFKEGTPPVLPAPLGDNAPGSISVTFYNNAPREALVRITGPTAHEFVLPPCPDCPAYNDGCPSLQGKPSQELRLGPGVYDRLVSSPQSATPTPLAGTSTYEPGPSYTNCLFVSSALG